MSCTSDLPTQPILTITTSKNWVLPPRPKNTRKAKVSQEKRKPKSSATTPGTATTSTTANSSCTATSASGAIPASSASASAAATSVGNPSSSTKYSKQLHPISSQALTVPIKTSQSSPSSIVKAPLSNYSPSTCVPAKLNIYSPDDLLIEVRAIELENYHLKTKLLLLINDYKTIKNQVVLHSPVADLYDTATSTRKRMFEEMGDPMSELITDLNGLSHASPATLALVSPIETGPSSSTIENNLFDFVNLEENNSSLDLEDEVVDEEVVDEDDLDEDTDSACLSRMTSPSSESDEHLLMTTLTRSTTVSTTNSSSDKRFNEPFKLYDLPAYSEDDYAFLFENMDAFGKKMSIIEEDHYNQVTDFLEEKLLSNDIKYYVEKSHTLRL